MSPMICTSDSSLLFFFFNDTATTEIYTLSLHDALPISAGQRLVEPLELIAADACPRARHRAVEGRHVAHALLGRHLLGGPVVGAAADRVESDEADALVVEGPVRRAEELLPLGAHVQVPVVLTRDEDFPDLHLLEDVVAETELDGIAELGEVTPVDQEVGRRRHRLDFLDRAGRLLDEARVDVLRVQMVSESQANLKASAPNATSRVLISGNHP